MMDCPHSMAPDDEDLIKYVLDEEPLPDKEKEHLAHCPICQQRFTSLKRTNTFLLSKLYRSECPNVEDLHDYCYNFLSSDRAMDIYEHVQRCPLCTLEVADIRSALATFEPFPEPETETLSVFSPRAALRRIVASFIPMQPQLVTRGEEQIANAPWPRQYRAEALNISLHLSRASNGDTILLGIITSEDSEASIDIFEGSIAKLYPKLALGEHDLPQNLPDQLPSISTEVDDMGNLAFRAVPTGEYVMFLYLPNAELVIKGLTIDHG